MPIAVFKSGTQGPRLGNPGPELKVEKRKMNHCMNVFGPYAVFYKQLTFFVAPPFKIQLTISVLLHGLLKNMHARLTN